MPETMIEKLPQHRQIVRGFVMKLVGDAALADDLTQESFVRATRTEKSHRGDASERAWLSAIALNLVRDHFRATKRRPQTISDDGFLDGIESSDTGRSMGVENLHPRDWFEPFDSADAADRADLAALLAPTDDA